MHRLRRWSYKELTEDQREQLDECLEPIEHHFHDAQFIRISERGLICLLTLKNGFEVVGTAFVLDPAEFDPDLAFTTSMGEAVRRAEPVVFYCDSVQESSSSDEE